MSKSREHYFKEKIKKIALEVLDTHRGVAEYYRRMNTDQRLAFVQPFTADSNLLPPSDEKLRKLLERRLEITPTPVVAEHHFPESYVECVQTYYSGYFIACTMMAQSFNEGIINFVARRNNLELGKRPKVTTTIDKLRKHATVPHGVIQAAEAISNSPSASSRNDIRHMNEGISNVEDWHKQANKNLRGLTIVESYVFGYDIEGTDFLPHFEKYWDYYDCDHIRIRAIPSGIKGVLRIRKE